MIGLTPGDAKIFRNRAARVTRRPWRRSSSAVHLLNVDRVLVVPHTRCAVASSSEDELRRRVGESAGQDASWQSFGVVEDQEATLRADVAAVRSHPLVPTPSRSAASCTTSTPPAAAQVV